MSLFLSKVLSQLIHPLILEGILVAIGGGLASWRRGWGLPVVALGLLVVWVPATPVVADWLLGSLEDRFPPRPVAAVPTADAIVTLGGAIGAPIPPREHPDLSGAADRVWHAARLYRAGKAPLIIASGGTLPWHDQRFREADAIKALRTSWGVPADAVLRESTSSNTYQNAKNTAAILEKRGIDQVLLVTSALHTRRALATFRSAGVPALPAATDYRVVDTPFSVFDLVPSAGALGGALPPFASTSGIWSTTGADGSPRRRCRSGQRRTGSTTPAPREAGSDCILRPPSPAATHDLQNILARGRLPRVVTASFAPE